MHKGFIKEDSTLLKGCAIMMLIFCHLFSTESRFKGYSISFFPFLQNEIIRAASMFKICVGIFAFVSGYGLYLSYQKQDQNQSGSIRWTVMRVTKLLLSFFFCYAICFTVSMAIDQAPIETYFSANPVRGIVYLLIDSMGLNTLFSTPTLNGSWWYMSTAFLFIVLLPLVFPIVKKVGYFPVLILFISIPRLWGSGYPGGTNPVSFILPFILGMEFADYSIFDKLDKWLETNKYAPLALTVSCSWGVFLTFVLYANLKRSEFWDLEFSPAPIPWLLFFIYILGSVPFLRKPLIFFGEHSMTIFLTHTFIRARYLHSLIYSCRHFLLVFCALFLSSLFVAVVIDWLRIFIGYDRLSQKVIMIVLGSDYPTK